MPMYDVLTPDLKRSLFDRRSREAVLIYLTLEHNDLDGPLHFVNNTKNVDITRNGTLFKAFPFQGNMPTDDDGIPKAELVIGNVDFDIVQAILNIRPTPIRTTFDIAPASRPDLIIRHHARLLMLDVVINELTITGQLKQSTIENEPAISIHVNPYRFPGLF